MISDQYLYAKTNYVKLRDLLSDTDWSLRYEDIDDSLFSMYRQPLSAISVWVPFKAYHSSVSPSGYTNNLRMVPNKKVGYLKNLVVVFIRSSSDMFE